MWVDAVVDAYLSGGKELAVVDVGAFDFIGDGNTYAAMVPQVAHPFGVGIIHNVFVAYAGNIRRPKAVVAVPGGH